MELSPANLRRRIGGKSAFGVLWSYPLDGQVYAQPLVLTGVHVKDKPDPMDLVIVGTQHNSLYAFDATSKVQPRGPVWHWRGKDDYGMRPVPTIRSTAGMPTHPPNVLNCYDIVTEVGITGTPVIDEKTYRIYFVVKSYEKGRPVGTEYVQRLCRVDARTGENAVPPHEIRATYPGTGTGLAQDEADDEGHRAYALDAGYSSLNRGTNDGHGNVRFLPKVQNQRAGLLLLDGVVYVGWSSHGDVGAFHGWLMGFDAGTLAPVSVFNASPNGFGASIWQGGVAPAADSEGHIYLTTGNGSFTARGPLFDEGTDWGNCVLKLSTRGRRLRVIDYFSPFDRECLNGQDLDLGSGGVLLPPARFHAEVPVDPLLLVTAGKDGTLYILDRERLGQQALSRADNVFRRFPEAVGEKYGMGAFFEDRLYYGGGRKKRPKGEPVPGDVATRRAGQGFVETPIRKLSIPDVLKMPRARFAEYTHLRPAPSEPTAGPPEPVAFPDKGTTPSISSNGSKDAVLWALSAPWWGEAIELEFLQGRGTNAEDRDPPARARHNAPASALFAFDAETLELVWSSQQEGLELGDRIKFAVPTVANGRVFIGTGTSADGNADGTLTVFGLR
jgi:outer membrane protein assembly factor BamB